MQEGVSHASWTIYGVRILGVVGDKGCLLTVSLWIPYIEGKAGNIIISQLLKNAQKIEKDVMFRKILFSI